MTQRRTLGFALFAASMACADLAAAATIHFDRSSIDNIAAGERVTLEILGSGFTDGSAGGGLNLKWDGDVLGIAALTDIELLFPGDQFVFDKGSLDAAAGTLTNLSTNSFNGIAATSFKIARVTFTALAAGTSSIELGLGSFATGGNNVWTTAAGIEIASLGFEAASLTVVAPVPVPAALVLLSGALTLLGVRTRSQVSAVV